MQIFRIQWISAISWIRFCKCRCFEQKATSAANYSQISFTNTNFVFLVFYLECSFSCLILYILSVSLLSIDEYRTTSETAIDFGELGVSEFNKLDFFSNILFYDFLKKINHRSAKKSYFAILDIQLE